VTQPGPTYIVQLATDPEPRPTYEVNAGEYERLLELGMLVGGPAEPAPPDLFDQEVAQLINNLNSVTYASGRAQFTPRATTLPPSNPAIGDLWFS
jgi:hypothetical protein